MTEPGCTRHHTCRDCCMQLGSGKGILYKDGVITEIKDDVVREETVAIYYNRERELITKILYKVPHMPK